MENNIYKLTIFHKNTEIINYSKNASEFYVQSYLQNKVNKITAGLTHDNYPIIQKKYCLEKMVFNHDDYGMGRINAIEETIIQIKKEIKEDRKRKLDQEKSADPNRYSICTLTGVVRAKDGVINYLIEKRNKAFEYNIGKKKTL